MFITLAIIKKILENGLKKVDKEKDNKKEEGDAQFEIADSRTVADVIYTRKRNETLTINNNKIC